MALRSIDLRLPFSGPLGMYGRRSAARYRPFDLPIGAVIRRDAHEQSFRSENASPPLSGQQSNRLECHRLFGRALIGRVILAI